MTLEDIIGPQPSTGPEGPNPEGLEWIISTAIDELRSEKEHIEDFSGPDDDEAWCSADACDAKILYLEMELARIQLELRILLDH